MSKNFVLEQTIKLSVVGVLQGLKLLCRPNQFRDMFNNKLS